MQSIGMDIHRKHINACIRDEAGEIVCERKLRADPAALDKFLSRVDKEDKIAIESCNCWEHIYDYLDDAGYTNVVLANPCQISKDKRKPKTDKLDARKLSKLLSVNMLPLSWVAPQDVRNHRQITRHKASLTVMRSMLKNKINAILARNGIVHEYSDVFGVAGTQYLLSIDLEMRDRIQVDNYLSAIEHLNKLIDKTQDVIEDFAKYNYNIKILMSHPGIDYYLASMIDAEIGDIRRFKKGNKLVRYSGLDVVVKQSGDKCHRGRISKQGNSNLRWALAQASHVAVMRDRRYALMFHKIKAKSNKYKAYTAVSRRILKTIFAMLRNNAYYIPLKEDRKAS